jgi:hypothetical protein
MTEKRQVRPINYFNLTNGCQVLAHTSLHIATLAAAKTVSRVSVIQIIVKQIITTCC